MVHKFTSTRRERNTAISQELSMIISLTLARTKSRRHADWRPSRIRLFRLRIRFENAEAETFLICIKLSYTRQLYAFKMPPAFYF